MSRTRQASVSAALGAGDDTGVGVGAKEAVSAPTLQLNDTLTTVHSHAIRTIDVVNLLKIKRLFRSAIYELIEHRVVVDHAADLGVLSPMADRCRHRELLRQTMGLADPVVFQTYLRQNGISQETWNEYALGALLKDLLKDTVVTDAMVDAHFASNRERFDAAVVARIIFRSEDDVRLVLDELAAGADFATCARRYSIDRSSKFTGGFLGEVRRGIFSAPVDEQIFLADDGCVLGPFNEANAITLYKVEEVRRCEDVGSVAPRIREHLFAEWLRREVSTARA